MVLCEDMMALYQRMETYKLDIKTVPFFPLVRNRISQKRRLVFAKRLPFRLLPIYISHPIPYIRYIVRSSLEKGISEGHSG